MDIRNRKPLWGFGPIGWVALAILTTLIVALLRGWDPVHACAALIWTYSNDQLTNWVRIWVIVWFYPAVMMNSVTFGIWGLLYTSVALFICPRKLPVLPFVLLFVSVTVQAFAYGAVTPLMQSKIPIHAMTLLHILASAAGFVLIWCITRRWWCAAPLLIPLLWHIAVPDETRVQWAWPLFEPVRLATHAVTAGTLLSWAIAARLKPAPAVKPCPNCHYDLTGLATSTPCPECGRTPAAPSAQHQPNNTE